MKNGCEIDTRVCCILRCIFLIKCRVPVISGGHAVLTEESECKSIICFSFWGWNWSLSRWSEGYHWAEQWQRDESRDTYLGFEVSFLGLWTFGFCNLTVSLPQNHLPPLPNLRFYSPRWPIYSEIFPFEKWLLPPIQGNMNIYFRHFLSRECQLIQMCCGSARCYCCNQESYNISLMPWHSYHSQEIKPLSFTQCTNLDLTSLLCENRCTSTLYWPMQSSARPKEHNHDAPSNAKIVMHD